MQFNRCGSQRATPCAFDSMHYLLSRKEEIFIMNRYSLLQNITACLLALLCALCAKAYAQQTSLATQAASTSSADTAIPAARLLQPAELVQILRSSGGEKPLILQVGPHVPYADAHIYGSEYLGAAGQDSGRQALEGRVKKLDRAQFLVIYCGCCPWNKCPNIRPAYQQLTSLGFTQVKVLYLADNFGTNWVAKGYPITKGR